MPSVIPPLPTSEEPAVKRSRIENGSPSGLTPEERFFFDLNGFIILRGVLSPQEVKAANAAIDAHKQDICERMGELRNTKAGSPLSGDGKSGRRDLAGIMEWPGQDSVVFKSLLAHPKLVPYLLELLGDGYRMDHLPFVILQNKGSEGFSLHGGPLNAKGKLNPTLQYRCEDGAFYNSLMAMSVQLSDHGPGDGGFCAVRGSHKMKFPMPAAFQHGEAFQEHLYQPVTKAGDVVFFSEATVHGAMPWTADHERRVALYRFAPCTSAYGRAYYPEWPSAMLEGLTPAQRAVLEPPYALRLDRPLVRAGSDEVTIQSRSEAKKAFDREVFKTQYF
eukprot:TRINITY_DN50434_c0_g1_i1.p1 TRINITY_DN50434_c0_g1~~TRINITY_DN50434_c0_g1_i1.p1  ORF type:complete len:333 (-),score=52.54 TRINITY_DN50434_c0_g1_i1:131-1129(-)